MPSVISNSISICLLIPSLQAGGMERVMSRLIQHFAAKPGIELHLILYGIKREVFYPLPAGVKVHRPGFIFDNRFRLWHTVKTLWYLRQKFKQLRPDTVLSFGELWNNFVLLALYGLKTAVYVSDRCQPDKSLGRFQDWLRKWLYPRAAGVIAQTEKAKQLYQTYFQHSNIAVIGNPIWRIGANPAIPRENIVLSVGRLIHSKHYDALIRLFAEINQPDWRLVIVGGDALKQQNQEKLQALVRELQAEDRVALVGRQSDVEAYYQRSKIFAFTSSSEGFPNVIGEALSAGLPVVAFDCIAGPSEMIQDGYNGYLVDLFDYATFKQRLQGLMEDETLRQKLASNAPRSISKFDEAEIGEQFYQFITSHL
jgi:GalNAc-alpha-(1->4)-GalNAc-alpha-(1->3)-diNAcBac-PP-undecaprenol alpha-1,4-N-acetyl-D-galactosaminyltransferase